MIKFKLSISLLTLTCLMGLSNRAKADEFYPSNPFLREFGTDQGNVGDCAAQAEVGALENAFLARGYEVKLSLFYTHVVNHLQIEPHLLETQQEHLHLNINDDDRAIVSHVGEILPNYMWPEDELGYNPHFAGMRPHLSEVAAIDPSFPHTSQFGFSKTDQSFHRPFFRRYNLNVIKNAIRARKAVVLSIHGELMQSREKWNLTTGLLRAPYRWSDLVAKQLLADGKGDMVAGIDHAVAVVGFDDTLYADSGYVIPGAFIVRNTWIDAEEVAAILDEKTNQNITDARMMRLKFYSKNLPGTYAIPYQYFIDLLNYDTHDGFYGIGGWKLYNLDYAKYAQVYQDKSVGYEALEAPYDCESRDGLSHSDAMAKDAVARFGEAIETGNTQSAFDIASTESHLHNYDQPEFKYATLARNKRLGIDRVSDFYQGRFNTYYCPSDTGSTVWPYYRQTENPEFRAAITQIANEGNSTRSWWNFFIMLLKTRALDGPQFLPNNL